MVKSYQFRWPLQRSFAINTQVMLKRPLCKACNLKPAAINYIKNKKHHFRSRCGSCNAGNKPLFQPNISQYKKKNICERCGFKSKLEKQLFTHFIDGDRKNTKKPNLKTVCSNCNIELNAKGLDWKQGDLIPDF